MSKRDRWEKELRAGTGRPASATILKSKKLWYSSSGNQFGAVQYYELKLQVRPDGEPSFEATVKTDSNTVFFKPAEGAEIAVLYDPNDHEKVVVTSSASAGNPALQALLEQATSGLSTPTPAQSAAPATVGLDLERLNQLADLRDRGALTEAEFAAEKRKLLGG